jgi:hypothetical protein
MSMASMMSKQQSFSSSSDTVVWNTHQQFWDPDPDVVGPSESGSISQRYGSGSGSWSGSGSFPFLINVLGGLKKCLQYKILTQNFSKKLNFLVWRWCGCGQAP